MKTILKKTNDIKPYINNPRKQLNIDKVAASIKEFGFQQPIVVDKNNVIIVGHTRHLAAKQLQLKQVPVVIADTLSEVKAKAYRLADNRTNQDSDWDFELLQEEFKELLNINYDISKLGFSDIEFTNIDNIQKDTKDWLDTEKEWKGMPKYEHENDAPFRRIIFNFETEKDVEDFFKKVGITITERTSYVNIPEREKKVLKDKGYISKK